jgi:hypothetical protein
MWARESEVVLGTSHGTVAEPSKCIGPCLTMRISDAVFFICIRTRVYMLVQTRVYVMLVQTRA